MGILQRLGAWLGIDRARNGRRGAVLRSLDCCPRCTTPNACNGFRLCAQQVFEAEKRPVPLFAAQLAELNATGGHPVEQYAPAAIDLLCECGHRESEHYHNGGNCSCCVCDRFIPLVVHEFRL